MASTMYAWTTIRNGEQVISAGDSVKKGDFSESDWEQLLESRSVRTNKYPNIPADFGGSPREFMIRELNRQIEETEGLLSDEELLEIDRTADAEVEDNE